MDSVDVLVIGGGNAALCAALQAREEGASVLLLEAAPKAWRAGNSAHIRNIRCMHDVPQDVLVDAYPEEEFWQDLFKVTGGLTNEKLARIVIRHSATCRPWLFKHGARFQPSITGALHTARTNAFFMGGGKTMMNAYYRSAERLGVQIRYQSPVERIDIRDGNFVCAYVHDGCIKAKTCVLAAGGFESNREWLREAWGQNEWGEYPTDNFRIRGTRFNTGSLLKFMIDSGADKIGEPNQSHMVAIDARAPLYDGGVCTRIDCVSLGIVVNHEGRRFYDEGEDFWPKRYAIWGRLVAHQRGQVGYVIIDAKSVGRFMPPVFPGVRADSLEELADGLALDRSSLLGTIKEFNTACVPGVFDHTILDGCHTDGISPSKTNWARPIDTPPYFGYTVRPGMTFTYLGLLTNEKAQVHFSGKPSENLFVAGEMMVGNVLGKGYNAGVGMTIGTAFGRIAGWEAAAKVFGRKEKNHVIA